MSSLAKRTYDQLKKHAGEWLTAVDVARQLGMNTGAGGERYIRAVANELCSHVDAGFARLRLPDADVPACRYQLKEVSSAV